MATAPKATDKTTPAIAPAAAATATATATASTGVAVAAKPPSPALSGGAVNGADTLSPLKLTAASTAATASPASGTVAASAAPAVAASGGTGPAADPMESTMTPAGVFVPPAVLMKNATTPRLSLSNMSLSISEKKLIRIHVDDRDTGVQAALILPLPIDGTIADLLPAITKKRQYNVPLTPPDVTICQLLSEVTEKERSKSSLIVAAAAVPTGPPLPLTTSVRTLDADVGLRMTIVRVKPNTTPVTAAPATTAAATTTAAPAPAATAAPTTTTATTTAPAATASTAATTTTAAGTTPVKQLGASSSFNSLTDSGGKVSGANTPLASPRGTPSTSIISAPASNNASLRSAGNSIDSKRATRGSSGGDTQSIAAAVTASVGGASTTPTPLSPTANSVPVSPAAAAVPVSGGASGGGSGGFGRSDSLSSTGSQQSNSSGKPVLSATTSGSKSFTEQTERLLHRGKEPSPLSKADEQKLAPFLPLSKNIKKLKEFFFCVQSLPRATHGFILDNYCMLQLTNPKLAEPLLDNWFDWLFPLMLQSAAAPATAAGGATSDYSLNNLLTAIISQVHYFEFVRFVAVDPVAAAIAASGFGGSGSTTATLVAIDGDRIRYLLRDRLLLPIQSFAWTDASIGIVRLILSSFLKIIRSGLVNATGGGWRIDVKRVEWANWFATVLVIEEFVLRVPIRMIASQKINLGLHLQADTGACADEKLVDLVVEVWMALQLDKLERAIQAVDPEEDKLRKQYVRRGVDDLKFWMELQGLVRGLRLWDASPFDTNFKRRWKDMLVARGGYSSFMSTIYIDTFLIELERDVKSIKNTRLIAGFGAFAKENEEQKAPLKKMGSRSSLIMVGPNAGSGAGPGPIGLPITAATGTTAAGDATSASAAAGGISPRKPAPSIVPATAAGAATAASAGGEAGGSMPVSAPVSRNSMFDGLLKTLPFDKWEARLVLYWLKVEHLSPQLIAWIEADPSNEMDGSVLMSLTEDEFNDCGVTNRPHRIKLVQAIKRKRESFIVAGAAACPPQPSTAATTTAASSPAAAAAAVKK